MRRSIQELDPSRALRAWSETTAANADPWIHHPCKLVTPLYGGGVRAAEVDTQMPIRAAGIRGQLRFWWRFVAGPFASSEEMFQREAAIWGGIASAGPTASRVAMRVDRITGLDIKPAFVYQPNHNKPSELKTMPEAADWVESYALFPARGELSQDKRTVAVEPHRLALAGLGFRLSLKLDPRLTPEQRREVQTALRWWASFGGVGARTRRGLGAVRVDGLDPVTADEVRATGGTLVSRTAEKTAEAAWTNAVGQLRDFRQKLDVGRNNPSANTQSPAGRSRWPEADAIRALSGHALPKHAERIVSIDVFPRAAFGLPIVFHFKDAPAKPHLRNGELEPDQHILEPADLDPNNKRDRMASPLILRPYWDGRQWRPAALLLPALLLPNSEQYISRALKFKDQPYCPTPWPSPSDPAERQRLAAQIKPMAGRGDDPLTAFMDYFEQD